MEEKKKEEMMMMMMMTGVMALAFDEKTNNNNNSEDWGKYAEKIWESGENEKKRGRVAEMLVTWRLCPAMRSVAKTAKEMADAMYRKLHDAVKQTQKQEDICLRGSKLEMLQGEVERESRNFESEDGIDAGEACDDDDDDDDDDDKDDKDEKDDKRKTQTRHRRDNTSNSDAAMTQENDDEWSDLEFIVRRCRIAMAHAKLLCMIDASDRKDEKDELAMRGTTRWKRTGLEKDATEANIALERMTASSVFGYQAFAEELRILMPIATRNCSAFVRLPDLIVALRSCAVDVSPMIASCIACLPSALEACIETLTNPAAWPYPSERISAAEMKAAASSIDEYRSRILRRIVAMHSTADSIRIDIIGRLRERRQLPRLIIALAAGHESPESVVLASVVSGEPAWILDALRVGGDAAAAQSRIPKDYQQQQKGEAEETEMDIDLQHEVSRDETPAVVKDGSDHGNVEDEDARRAAECLLDIIRASSRAAVTAVSSEIASTSDTARMPSAASAAAAEATTAPLLRATMAHAIQRLVMHLRLDVILLASGVYSTSSRGGVNVIRQWLEFFASMNVHHAAATVARVRVLGYALLCIAPPRTPAHRASESGAPEVPDDMYDAAMRALLSGEVAETGGGASAGAALAALDIRVQLLLRRYEVTKQDVTDAVGMKWELTNHDLGRIGAAATALGLRDAHAVLDELVLVVAAEQRAGSRPRVSLRLIKQLLVERGGNANASGVSAFSPNGHTTGSTLLPAIAACIATTVDVTSEEAELVHAAAIAAAQGVHEGASQPGLEPMMPGSAFHSFVTVRLPAEVRRGMSKSSGALALYYLMCLVEERIVMAKASAAIRDRMKQKQQHNEHSDQLGAGALLRPGGATGVHDEQAAGGGHEDELLGIVSGLPIESVLGSLEDRLDRATSSTRIARGMVTADVRAGGYHDAHDGEAAVYAHLIGIAAGLFPERFNSNAGLAARLVTAPMRNTTRGHVGSARRLRVEEDSFCASLIESIELSQIERAAARAQDAPVSLCLRLRHWWAERQRSQRRGQRREREGGDDHDDYSEEVALVTRLIPAMLGRGPVSVLNVRVDEAAEYDRSLHESFRDFWFGQPLGARMPLVRALFSALSGCDMAPSLRKLELNPLMYAATAAHSGIYVSPPLFEVYLAVLSQLLTACARHAYLLTTDLQRTLGTASAFGPSDDLGRHRFVLLSDVECEAALLVQEATCYQVLLDALARAQQEAAEQQIARSSRVHESSAVLFRCLHSRFIEDVGLVRFLVHQTFPVALVRPMLDNVQSMYVCVILVACLARHRVTIR